LEAAPGERRIGNWCVRATAYGALDRGYAATLIADLNIALTWLDYPGRKNRAIGVGDLVF
jgi:hypothetical protein